MARDAKEYSLMESRPRFLAQTFQKSRDNWKRKCQEAKAEIKSLRDRIRDLELSRAKWRDDAETFQRDQQNLREEVERLQAQLTFSAAAVAESEKKERQGAD